MGSRRYCSLEDRGAFTLTLSTDVTNAGGYGMSRQAVKGNRRIEDQEAKEADRLNQRRRARPARNAAGKQKGTINTNWQFVVLCLC
jgi:hypothetical protein